MTEEITFTCYICGKTLPYSEITFKEQDENGDEPICQDCLQQLLEGLRKHPEDPLWWGYRHINGSYQVKRYFNELDLQDAEESNMVGRVFQPFPSKGREEALEEIEEKDKSLK